MTDTHDPRMPDDAGDPRVTAYVFGELSAQEQAEFEAELAESEELRSLVEQTRKTVSLLEQEICGVPPTRLLPEQRAAVAAGIAEAAASGGSAGGPSPATKPVPASPAAGRVQISGWAVGAACALLLAVIAGGAVFVLAPASSRRVATAPSPRITSESQSPARRLPDPTGLDPLPADESISLQMGEEMRMNLELEAEELEGVPNIAGLPSAPAGVRAKDIVASHPFPATAPTTGPQAGQDDGRPAAIRAEMSDVQISNATDAASSLATHSLATVVPSAEPSAEPARAGRGISDEGTGPGLSGDQFDPITENTFQRTDRYPLSTFSIDVDTAAYSKVRMFLQNGQLPRPAAVRLEELINYFRYDYAPPAEDGEDPFASHLAVSECPWAPGHRLVRIALKGRVFESQRRPDANLVFLLDVSGSMDSPNKLPLLKRGMKMLTRQLTENDRVAIVVYAGAAGLVLDSTSGARQGEILAALDRLQAGGSTNGGQGIRLAYQTALDNYLEDGVNRVILCSDGDFNVGTTGTDELVDLAAKNAETGVSLSVLGFGMGNHNDAMMERISNRGNGNYAFIDNDSEAAKVLVEQMNGTLVTIAKDVKVQVEFNPTKVAAYRMLGYENRRLAAEDFDDDTKDAGEIGAGHTVTMLYEIVPADAEAEDADAVPPAPSELKYQRAPGLTEAAASDELLTVALRYKQPDADVSKRLEFPLEDRVLKFGEADRDFRFAAAVASFGMLLRDSEHRGDTSYDAVLEIAAEAAGRDPLRLELLQLIRQAKALSP